MAWLYTFLHDDNPRWQKITLSLAMILIGCAIVFSPFMILKHHSESYRANLDAHHAELLAMDGPTLAAEISHGRHVVQSLSADGSILITRYASMVVSCRHDPEAQRLISCGIIGRP